MGERSNRSPFPGMDPFLESEWGGVRVSLLAYVRDALQALLPDDLIARIDGEPPKSTETEDLPVERWIQVIEHEDAPLITILQIIDPWHKAEGSARDDYLRRRKGFLARAAHLVEIDLVRAGTWWTMLDPHSIPDDRLTACRVSVSRRGCSEHPIGLRNRLPVIGVPLRAGEARAALDFQPLVERVYVNGRCHYMDYSKPCDPPLEEDDAEWAQELLRKAGRV